jgi:hypothetical protein
MTSNTRLLTRILPLSLVACALAMAALPATSAGEAVDSLTIYTSPDTTNGLNCSSFTHSSADRYLAIVEGVVKYADEPRYGDALYSGIRTIGILPPPWGAGSGLYVQYAPVPLQPYSDAHVYSYEIQGPDGPFCAWFADSYYGDNQGTFTITFVQCFSTCPDVGVAYPKLPTLVAKVE